MQNHLQSHKVKWGYKELHRVPKNSKNFQGVTKKNETLLIDNQPIQVRCTWCKYNSFKIGRVEKHIKTVHLKIKDFNCNTCGYKTSQEGRLKTHMEKVHQKS